MTDSLEHIAELYDLSGAQCDGELSAQQLARIEDLLLGQGELRRRYILYMQIHAAAEFARRTEPPAMWCEPRGLGASVQGLGTSVPSSVASRQSAVGSDDPSVHHLSFIIHHSAPPVPFIVVDNTLPSPLSSLPSFLFSYTVAAIIFGLAGLAGWFYQIEHHTEFARSFGTQSSPTAIEQATPAEQPAQVARITGMVDCRWERKGLGIRDWGLDKRSGGRAQGSGLPSPDQPSVGARRGAGGEGGQSPIPNPQSPVCLGDKLTLASGLLQLTYQSGAKVILQGPCTYEVDSPAGGFLSVGKLTARVESAKTRAEGGPRRAEKAANPKSQISKSQISNPQSLIPNPSPLAPRPSPLFTIKTPTATVTDLGTEFGVEVDAQRVSHVETFIGLVKVSPTAEGKLGGGRPVAVGEAVRIDSRGLIATTPVKPKHFARSMEREELPYVKAVLEDHPVAYWPLADAPGVTWVADRSGHGCLGRVCGTLRPAQRGPLENQRSRAIEFTGDGYITVYNPPRLAASTGFTVEAWARYDGGSESAFAVVCSRDERGPLDLLGFTLYVNPVNVWGLLTGTGVPGRKWEEVVGPKAVLGEWVHLVGVFEPTGENDGNASKGAAKLYVNGALVDEVAQRFVPNDRQLLLIGAGSPETTSPRYLFCGRIAEVALYDRPLDSDRIKLHWLKGKKEEKP